MVQHLAPLGTCRASFYLGLEYLVAGFCDWFCDGGYDVAESFYLVLYVGLKYFPSGIWALVVSLGSEGHVVLVLAWRGTSFAYLPTIIDDVVWRFHLSLEVVCDRKRLFLCCHWLSTKFQRPLRLLGKSHRPCFQPSEIFGPILSM